jgi:hypothetical protein
MVFKKQLLPLLLLLGYGYKPGVCNERTNHESKPLLLLSLYFEIDDQSFKSSTGSWFEHMLF